MIFISPTKLCELSLSSLLSEEAISVIFISPTKLYELLFALFIAAPEGVFKIEELSPWFANITFLGLFLSSSFCLIIWFCIFIILAVISFIVCGLEVFVFLNSKSCIDFSRICWVVALVWDWLSLVVVPLFVGTLVVVPLFVVPLFVVPLVVGTLFVEPLVVEPLVVGTYLSLLLTIVIVPFSVTPSCINRFPLAAPVQNSALFITISFPFNVNVIFPIILHPGSGSGGNIKRFNWSITTWSADCAKLGLGLAVGLIVVVVGFITAFKLSIIILALSWTGWDI